jgi:hypothetical protein
MSFHGTTESLSSFASEVSVEREQRLQALLSTYEQQLEAKESMPDRCLLQEAEALLRERIASVPLIDQELAHLGVILFDHLHQWEDVCHLLSRYRAQDLPIYEEAWARWCLIDVLALQRCCDAVVEQQPVFLQWAMQCLPLEQCLFVMNDTTQAFCWHAVGKQEQWFAIFDDLMAHVKPTQENRKDRFLYMRTAINVHLRSEKTEQALVLLSLLYQLVQEDASWEGNDDLFLETQALQIEILSLLQQRDALRLVGKEATEYLMTWKHQLEDLSIEQKRSLRRWCHNLATSLSEAKEYDLALPLFQLAIVSGVTSPQTYLWLAACLWRVTREPSQVYKCLAQAKEYDPGGKIVRQFWRVPEFEDLSGDHSFQEIGQC